MFWHLGFSTIKIWTLKDEQDVLPGTIDVKLLEVNSEPHNRPDVRRSGWQQVADLCQHSGTRIDVRSQHMTHITASWIDLCVRWGFNGSLLTLSERVLQQEHSVVSPVSSGSLTLGVCFVWRAIGCFCRALVFMCFHDLLVVFLVI